MADENIPDSQERAEASAGADQPGENLASENLPDDVEAFVVTDDEAEELEEITVENPTDPDGIDDEEQLAAAEDEARVAASTRPVKRKDRRSAEVADEPVGPAVATASMRPIRKKAATEVAAKGHATPRQKKHADAPATRRVTPGEFLKQVAEELRKVVWPTGSQLWQYFVVVLIYVLMMIAIVSLLDFAFGWTLLKLFG